VGGTWGHDIVEGRVHLLVPRAEGPKWTLRFLGDNHLARVHIAITVAETQRPSSHGNYATKARKNLFGGVDYGLGPPYMSNTRKR